MSTSIFRPIRRADPLGFSVVLFSLTVMVLLPTAVFGGDGIAQLYASECSRCHGPAGEGGKGGEYPRLAGLPAGYLKGQLEDFRDRKRGNKPMLPIFKAGKLSREQIDGLSAWLARQRAPGNEVLGIPQAPSGDLEWGQELYEEACAHCHGANGRGRDGTDDPPLAGQYPKYLIKQIVDFRSNRRGHEFRDSLFVEPDSDELDALLAWMVHLNR